MMNRVFDQPLTETFLMIMVGFLTHRAIFEISFAIGGPENKREYITQKIVQLMITTIAMMMFGFESKSLMSSTVMSIVIVGNALIGLRYVATVNGGMIAHSVIFVALSLKGDKEVDGIFLTALAMIFDMIELHWIRCVNYDLRNGK